MGFYAASCGKFHARRFSDILYGINSIDIIGCSTPEHSVIIFTWYLSCSTDTNQHLQFDTISVLWKICEIICIKSNETYNFFLNFQSSELLSRLDALASAKCFDLPHINDATWTEGETCLTFQQLCDIHKVKQEI